MMDAGDFDLLSQSSTSTGLDDSNCTTATTAGIGGEDPTHSSTGIDVPDYIYEYAISGEEGDASSNDTLTSPFGTLKNTRWAAKKFKEWCEKKVKQIDWHSVTAFNLNVLLRGFYGDLRNCNTGGDISRKSLIGIRAGLQRFIAGSPFNRKFNIINDPEFTSANTVLTNKCDEFDGATKKIRNCRKAIQGEDLQKLIRYFNLYTKDAAILQEFVWFSICNFFGCQSKERWRAMTKTTFTLKTDDSGISYVELNKSISSRNSRYNALPRKDRYLYVRMHTQMCVAAFELYVSKLSNLAEDFWQKPFSVVNPSSDVWYFGAPLGQNTLSRMMQSISKGAGLSDLYSSHCVPLTNITTVFKDHDDTQIRTDFSMHKNYPPLKRPIAMACSEDQFVTYTPSGETSTNVENAGQVLPTSDAGPPIAKKRKKRKKFKHEQCKMLSSDETYTITINKDYETSDENSILRSTETQPIIKGNIELEDQHEVRPRVFKKEVSSDYSDIQRPQIDVEDHDAGTSKGESATAVTAEQSMGNQQHVDIDTETILTSEVSDCDNKGPHDTVQRSLPAFLSDRLCTLVNTLQTLRGNAEDVAISCMPQAENTKESAECTSSNNRGDNKQSVLEDMMNKLNDKEAVVEKAYKGMLEVCLKLGQFQDSLLSFQEEVNTGAAVQIDEQGLGNDDDSQPCVDTRKDSTTGDSFSQPFAAPETMVVKQEISDSSLVATPETMVVKQEISDSSLVATPETMVVKQEISDSSLVSNGTSSNEIRVSNITTMDGSSEQNDTTNSFYPIPGSVNRVSSPVCVDNGNLLSTCDTQIKQEVIEEVVDDAHVNISSDDTMHPEQSEEVVDNAHVNISSDYTIHPEQSPQQSVFRCRCDILFPNRLQLEQHIHKDHKIRLTAPIQLNPSPVYRRMVIYDTSEIPTHDPNVSKPFVCHTCGEEFGLCQEILDHLLTHKTARPKRGSIPFY